LINASGNPDLVLNEIYAQPKVNITTHAGGSMLAIPIISQYPVEAMKFINLMHSDSKLLNMMLFGAEGTHWEFAEDGRVKILNSAWYGAHGGAWTLGNTMLQAVSTNEDPDKNRMLIEYSNDSVDHPSLGFRFRTEPVAAELTAIGAVADGLHRALMTGYVDPAVELPNYIEALKAAGLDTVKAEVEQQYEEWKATQE
jgi:putative aldouronate transport system substrate-binding protein